MAAQPNHSLSTAQALSSKQCTVTRLASYRQQVLHSRWQSLRCAPLACRSNFEEVQALCCLSNHDMCMVLSAKAELGKHGGVQTKPGVHLCWIINVQLGAVP